MPGADNEDVGDGTVTSSDSSESIALCEGTWKAQFLETTVSTFMLKYSEDSLDNSIYAASSDRVGMFREHCKLRQWVF